MAVKQMNLGNLYCETAVQKNSSFLCSGFLKMLKVKTTNGWYLNRRKVQLFSDEAE